jgi:hypothetical protein
MAWRMSQRPCTFQHGINDLLLRHGHGSKKWVFKNGFSKAFQQEGSIEKTKNTANAAQGFDFAVVWLIAKGQLPIASSNLQYPKSLRQEPKTNDVATATIRTISENRV